MIEDGLFIGLGFCVATLLALACLPVVFARASRAARARLALTLPASELEIAAARDGLRAQAAVAARRLEQRIETEQRTAALTRTELGQRTVSLVSAEQVAEALRRERDEQIVEIAGMVRAMRDNEAQRGALEKALHDADARIETASFDAAEQARRHAETMELAEARRGAIAALDIRAAGLQARLEDNGERLDRMVQEAADRDAALAAASGAFARERRLSTRLDAELATERTERKHEQARGEERDRRLLQRSDALAAAETRMAEQDRLLAARHAEIAALKARFAALEAELMARRETAGSDPRKSTDADALLCGAIVAIGDEALEVLAPSAVGSRADPAETPTVGAS